MSHFISLEDIHIASPCSADWNAMSGDHRARFCASCQKNVYNLSEMTREQAQHLINSHEGKLCVRFYRRHDGTILTQDCPIGPLRVEARLSKPFSQLFLVAGLAVLAAVFSGCSQTSNASVSPEVDEMRVVMGDPVSPPLPTPTLVPSPSFGASPLTIPVDPNAGVITNRRTVP